MQCTIIMGASLVMKGRNTAGWLSILLCTAYVTVIGLLITGCGCSVTDQYLPLCVKKDAEVVPALFLLGDSLLDSGNNNDFVSLAKVDHYPYGIDFPGNVATGRFSNGFNAADFFGFKFGLPLIPSYHYPATKGKRLLQGVNFASGGSGILPTTGKIYGKVDSLQDQVEELRKVKAEISEVVGVSAVEELFASAAFLVVSGSNDWLLSFFNPVLPIRISDKTTANRHRDSIIQTLISQLEAMYALGARKIIVAGLPALGCCPSQVMEYKLEYNGACANHINDVSKDYNEHLIPQVVNLNDKHPNASFAFIDIYSLILKAAQDPSAYGFKTGNTACCGIGKYKGFLTCLPGLQPCDNLRDHLFWDAYHPTQTFYPLLVDLTWSNGPPYTYPKSLQEILQPQSADPASTQDSDHSEL